MRKIVIKEIETLFCDWCEKEIKKNEDSWEWWGEVHVHRGECIKQATVTAIRNRQACKK